MNHADLPRYESPEYPETYGDILDWSIERLEDPEKKILFRMSETDIQITYAEFGRNVNKICNMLSECGVKKGDHVAIFLPNALEYAYLFHSLGKCGAVMVPIIQFLRGDPLKYILDHSDSSFLITSSELFSEKILPLIGSLKKLTRIFFIDDVQETGGIDAGLFSDYKECSPKIQTNETVTGRDIQGIWYTSGTTGLPKGAVIRHKTYMWRIFFFSNYFRLTSRSVSYYILPMYHSGYAVLGAPLVMAVGGEIVQVNWFSASRFWKDVIDYGVTFTASTGTIIPIMLNQPPSEEEAAAKEQLKLWIGWPVGDRETVKRRWPGIKFMELYGTTEVPIAAITDYENPQLGSAGPPAPYTDLKLIDPESRKEILGKDRVGEIVYRHKLGPDYMIKEYYKDPEKTKETIRDGYWYSGDLGLLDEEGNLHFTDRLKDYMRIGGENVSSTVVEGVIRGIPEVEEVAVVGVKGDLGHDEMVAHVVLKEGMSVDPENLFSFCNENMSYYMVPRYLVMRSELPKTATSRVEKYKLRNEMLVNATDRVELGIELRR
jgi:crotonobetaine/carnitine-CoA ligase